MVMPQGKGFIEFAAFEQAYEQLKKSTVGFANFDSMTIYQAALDNPMILIVLRTILGFTPPEWAYMATQYSGVKIDQGAVRNLDRDIRVHGRLRLSEKLTEKITILVDTACHLISQPPPEKTPQQIHRLDKADTAQGLISLQSCAQMGIPYAMLLYERFLGRPFAGHRDSISELKGDQLENAIEDLLTQAQISFRKTKRAERIPNFDQAPDFIIPSEFNPRIVIEAKITEDDGTARDKVTRIQHLAELSSRQTKDKQFQVVACIDGRGFAIRKEDMRKLLRVTGGKVFTLSTLPSLIDNTELYQYRCTQ